MEYRVDAVEWELVYPVRPHDPIGWVRRERDGFAARMEREDLGVFASADAAAEAIWGRFVEASYSRHASASVMHGSRERG